MASDLAVTGRTTGHGCGHCALGTAAVGAAVAVKEVYDKHKLKGTIRLYGTPAEETVIGKVYMSLDGQFNDLDACLHWHPGTKNRVWYASSKALISAKFTFHGLPAHASGQSRERPQRPRRRRVDERRRQLHARARQARHAASTTSSPTAGSSRTSCRRLPRSGTSCRANAHEDVRPQLRLAERHRRRGRQDEPDEGDHANRYRLPRDHSQSAALEDHLSQHAQGRGRRNSTRPTSSSPASLQAPLRADFGLKEDKPLNDAIDELPEKPYAADGGSTDVGDMSWHVPTSGLGTVCFAAGSPGHSWQNVAAIGSPIGHKGMLVAAKVLAMSAVDLLQDPKALKEAKADFDERMKGRKYTTKIPEGQKAPKSIR